MKESPNKWPTGNGFALTFAKQITHYTTRMRTNSIRTNTSLLFLTLLAAAGPGLGWSPPYFQDDLCEVRRGEKSGFINREAKLVIPCEWDKVAWPGFREGMAAVKRDSMWSYIGPSGDAAFPGAWEEARAFQEGVAAVQVKGKWGFIDDKGNQVIAFEWDWAGDFNGGLSPVKRGNEYGFIDRSGKMSVPLNDPTWFLDSEQSKFGEDLTAVGVKSDPLQSARYGFIDKTGNMVIPATWEAAGDFEEGFAAVKKGDKWGFIDRSGKTVIEPAWDGRWMPGFTHGLSRVSDGMKVGFIDKTGVVVIPLEWDGAGTFHENGLVFVWRGKKCGFANRNGDVVIPLEWDFRGFSVFREGLAPVTKDGKIGFIDERGMLKIPLFDPESDPSAWRAGR